MVSIPDKRLDLATAAGAAFKAKGTFVPPPAWPGSRRVMLFDLDETLYPRESGLIPHQRERVFDFMAEKLHVDREKVPALWQELFSAHNQTFAGLLAYQKEHNDTVEPFTEDEFEAAIRDGDPLGG